MALNQARYVHDLIEGVKRKTQRFSNQYDAGGSATFASNRGNKLRRDAQYVQQGHLNSPNAISLYKTEINYNGYKRNIICFNPPLVDDEGDIIEDEDEIEEGDASPLEDNIYEEIKLEDILCPLTNAAELPTHPSLSKPYLDKGLPEMIRIAEETLHKEQEILWKMKEFFIQFRGDATWAPVGEFHTAYDDFINGDTPLNGDGVHSNTSPPGHGDNAPLNGSSEDLKRSIEMADTRGDGNSKGNTADTDATAIDRQLANEMEGAAAINGKDWAAQQQGHTNGSGDSQLAVNGAITSGDHPMAEAPGDVSTNTVQEQDRPGEGDDDESQPQSHRMTTRAQAQRSASISRSSSPASSIPHIHPIFQFPVSAVPDPYAGLQLNDASATTTCLLQYVSKQEEIVRATKELYDGLLRALKMRKDVLKWSKAEGHVNEMSDGEDWYDREEWGLDQDLIKGREEEEDETAIAPGKKTRRGRAVKD